MEMKAETLGALGFKKFVEKSVEHLSIFTLCKINETYIPYTYKHGVKPEGGANMATTTKQTEGKGELLQENLVHKSNLEKLVNFAEELDEDGNLIPAFLAVLEMCSHS